MQETKRNLNIKTHKFFSPNINYYLSKKVPFLNDDGKKEKIPILLNHNSINIKEQRNNKTERKLFLKKNIDFEKNKNINNNNNIINKSNSLNNKEGKLIIFIIINILNNSFCSKIENIRI